MSDPKRLVDELGGGDLKEMLAAGRSELPDDRQLAALAGKLGILGGIGGAGAAGALGGGGGTAAGTGVGGAKLAATATTVKTGLALKLAGAIVVASAAGTGAVVITQRTEEPRAPVGIVATVSPSAIAPPLGSGRAPASASIASGEPLPAASASTASASTASSAPAIVRPAPSARPSFDDEVALLGRAQDALRTNPAQALTLADEHARTFGAGALIQEREVIAIEALVKTHRLAEAKTRAARFKARFPGSSHTRRIDDLLGD